MMVDDLRRHRAHYDVTVMDLQLPNANDVNVMDTGENNQKVNSI